MYRQLGRFGFIFNKGTLMIGRPPQSSDRSSRCPSPFVLQRTRLARTEKRTLLELLRAYGGFEAIDPCDKVYASLASRGTLLAWVSRSLYKELGSYLCRALKGSPTRLQRQLLVAKRGTVGTSTSGGVLAQTRRYANAHIKYISVVASVLHDENLLRALCN